MLFVRAILICLLVGLPLLVWGQVDPEFGVDGKIALNSFVSLTDGHLSKLADSLQTVAESPSARTADWGKIKPLLQSVSKRNAPSVLWFALRDGSYWTLDEGRIRENLRNRPYFPRLLAGQLVIGDLVVSKSTGKSVAIVAVPIFRQNRSIAGFLGASVYLDRLSAIVRRQMGIDATMIFYTFDRSPLLGMVWDASLIMVDPTKLGEPVARAFREMLTRREGVVSYTFRNVQRTVRFRKSDLTGWWYAFGVVKRD